VEQRECELLYDTFWASAWRNCWKPRKRQSGEPASETFI